MRRGGVSWRAAVVWVALLCGCGAPAWQRAPHDRFFQRIPAPRPHGLLAKTEAFDGWYAVDHAVVRPLAVTVNPGHYIERIIGGPPALDINHFGQVLDSPWFTNRIGRHRMSPDDVRRGPSEGGGPAPGPFIVTGGKAEGATPGLVIRDSAGAQFIVKFDPPAFPALSSGAEIISTKILWAAGYNVPENYVVTFDLARLKLDPNATTTGKRGAKIPMTQKRLDDLVALVNPYPDGTIRALFSRRIPGHLLGPFSYRGQRADDPNDHVPHERRRSLRGLWLFSAWLNNTDTRRANTMDTFVAAASEPSRGVIKHYLLDFGDALGAAGTKPKFPGQGYESRLDWSLIAMNFVTAGFVYRYWLPLQRSPFRSVGLYEAQVFDPTRWQPNLPNPAYDDAGPLDTYWAASIIAHFGPEHLQAIVDAAGYTEPGAKEWVLRVLLARQYKILRYAFEAVLPLDRPRVDGYTLSMVDLAVQTNLLLVPQEVRYEWRALSIDGTTLDEGADTAPRAHLKRAARALRSMPSWPDRPFLTVEWRRIDGESTSTRMRVHMRVVQSGVLPVALER